MWTGHRIESVDDYSGVLVELDEAHLHSHSYRLRRPTGFDDACDDDDGAPTKVGDDEGTAMLDMRAPEYSIEGLRNEVRRGAKGEKWTAYERKLLF